MRIRVALYARFSSDLQNPASATDQLRGLRSEIARRFPEWEVVAEERDESVSGTSMEGRDGLRRLLARAQERPRPFDALVVEDLSRLARNRADSVRMREQLAGAGVSVLSAADGFIDPESEAGLFLTGMKEVKAEADSRETGRRVRRGVRARVLKGWLSGRSAPFGYVRKAVFSQTETDADGRPRRLGVRLEVDPASGAAVTHAFSRYASGVGMMRISRELNDPAGPFRASKPGGYCTSFLRALLLNPVYLGQVVYARTRERRVRVGDEMKRRKVHVPRAEWSVAEGAHPALVDPSTWNLVAAKFWTDGKTGGADGGVPDAEPMPDARANADAGSNGPDAAGEDAPSPPASDAAVPVPADAATTPPRSGNGGCSCQLTGPPHGVSPIALLVTAGLGLTRRRPAPARRRRASSS